MTTQKNSVFFLMMMNEKLKVISSPSFEEYNTTTFLNFSKKNNQPVYWVRVLVVLYRLSNSGRGLLSTCMGVVLYRLSNSGLFILSTCMWVVLYRLHNSGRVDNHRWWIEFDQSSSHHQNMMKLWLPSATTLLGLLYSIRTIFGAFIIKLLLFQLLLLLIIIIHNSS